VKVLVIAAVAFAIVGAGVTEIVLVLRGGPAGQPVATASLNGLTATVSRAVWIGMDMPTETSGYQMPAGMMPGMPADGYQRLSVTVGVVNTGGGTRQVHVADEFTLRSADGKSWKAVVNTFGELPRLGPDNGVTGELYFDVPQADAETLSQARLWIEWNYEGGKRALEIPPVGGGPAHGHE
jgi:hypothetical protein